jgi:prepilin-type N-terminal cleavage/methylation domain-containing protein
MNGNLRSRANRGFTIVELIVVVTVIGFLAAITIGAYNKVVNDAKAAKSLALVNTLSTAKSLFVADPATTETNIQSFNASTGDTQFAPGKSVAERSRTLTDALRWNQSDLT